MRRKKITTRIFLLLTVGQLIIFVFRDHFQYQPYSSPAELYKPCDAACVTTWRQYADDYPAAELQAAKKLADSVTVGSPNSISKAVAIGDFLYTKFYHQLGRPSSRLLSASPMEQYRMLGGSDTVQLWCGNFAQMFAFFCWSEGIACRNIEIMKEGDHHVLNECYLPETGEWIMVDLTHNLLAVADSATHPLNAAAFTQALAAGRPLLVRHSLDGKKRMFLADRDRASLSAYYNPSYPVYYYHRTDNSKAYSTMNKIKQYFLPVSWYNILAPKERSNALFYLKDALALLWLLSFIAFVVKKLNT